MVVRQEPPHNYEVMMKKYLIINLLNGAVTIIFARSLMKAISQGQEYFSEPNRTKVPVQVFN